MLQHCLRVISAVLMWTHTVEHFSWLQGVKQSRMWAHLSFLPCSSSSANLAAASHPITSHFTALHSSYYICCVCSHSAQSLHPEMCWEHETIWAAAAMPQLCPALRLPCSLHHWKVLCKHKHLHVLSTHLLAAKHMQTSPVNYTMQAGMWSQNLIKEVAWKKNILYANRKSSFLLIPNAEERLLFDISAVSSVLLCHKKGNTDTSWRYLLFFKRIKAFQGFKSHQNGLQISREQQENHQWNRRVANLKLFRFAYIQRHTELSAKDVSEQDLDKKQRSVRTEKALQQPAFPTDFKEILSRAQTQFSPTGSSSPIS